MSLSETIMSNEIFEKICRQLNLGELAEQPLSLSGGFLHKMYSLFTTRGKYAVKLLNPYIMKRETARANFRTAEALEYKLERQSIPILPALVFHEKKMQEIDGTYFYLFDWFDGKAIRSGSVTTLHCCRIGESLAKIHGINKKMESYVQDELHIDWDYYIKQLASKNGGLCELLQKNCDLLYRMQEDGNAAIAKMPPTSAICHNDMDCKNVLWDGEDMRIIDLECLSYGSPFLELYETALCWSGYENCRIDFAKLTKLVGAYAQAGGELPTDWEVIHDCNVGRLGWLEYNVKRALGIECSEEEMALGVSEILATLPRIVYYDEVKNAVMECLEIY